MQSKSLFVAAVLALQQGVSAKNGAYTQEVCATKRTSPSPKGIVPTTSLLKTVRIPQQVYFTKTPATTITPSKVTITSTVTSTNTIISNVPQVTDTWTQTSTYETTTTVILPQQTVTSTESDTATTTFTLQSTTTVAEPSGFTPILDTLPGGAAKKRHALDGGANFARKGSMMAAVRAAKKQSLCPAIDGKKSPPPSWPAAVTCVGVVESFIPTTITRTAHTTKTFTAMTPYTTVTITASVTTTDIVSTPDASTTVTSTTTLVDTTTNTPVPTTTTTTTTTTVTVNSYAATAYAQCFSDSNNFAGTVSGQGISVVYKADNTGSTTAPTTSDSSAQACCSSCAANPLCEATAFYSGLPAGQQCYLILSTASTCSVGQYSLGVQYNGLASDAGYIVSNGNCGFVNVNGGSG